MPAAAAVGMAAASVYKGANSAKAATRAADEQRKQRETALGIQKDVYGESKANFDPYLAMGKKATETLSAQAGPEGSLGRAFTQSDYSQSPGYLASMREGMNAISNSASTRGGALSGGTLKSLQQYGQGLAAQDFDKAYNRFSENQRQNYSQLSGMSQQGQSAAGSLGSLGANFANQQTGTLGEIGDINAAGVIGKANAINKAITGVSKAGIGYANS